MKLKARGWNGKTGGNKEKLIRLVRMTLKETDYKVQVNGHISRSFNVRRGLTQEDLLSMTLFNIVLEKAIQNSQIPTRRTIYSQQIQVMAYADDIVILARNKENIIEQ